MSRLLVAFVLITAVALDPGQGRAETEAAMSFNSNTTSLHFDLAQANPPRSVTATVWYPTPPPPSEFMTAQAGIATGRFPVLLYFPGWGAKVEDNASLLASLARHGFIAVGLSYPKGAGLPDPAIPMQFAPDSAYAAGTAQGNRMVQIESEDGLLVLNALEKMDQGDPVTPLSGHLDTSRAGLLGYSLGGSVAAQTALRDHRFLAVMNLDGWMFGEVATRFFSRPYLVISDAQTMPTDADLRSPNVFVRNFSGLRVTDKERQTAQLEKSGGYRVTIAGSTHFTFSDYAKAGEKNAGPISPPLAMSIVSAHAAEFFGKYLDALPAPLLDHSSPSSQVKVERFPVPQ